MRKHAVYSPAKLLLVFAISQAVIGTLSAVSPAPSSDEILARLESENNRRHVLLKEYSGSRQYTLQNLRFGKQAAVAVLMNYRQLEGERYTVLERSGSDKLNGIIDKVLASETGASTPPENIRHEITSGNYRVRLLGTEIAAGRICYVLNLAPRVSARPTLARSSSKCRVSGCPPTCALSRPVSCLVQPNWTFAFRTTSVLAVSEQYRTVFARDYTYICL